MRNLLVIIAIILLVAWIVGFVIYHIVSGFIHILLALAVIAIVVRIVKGKNAA